MKYQIKKFWWKLRYSLYRLFGKQIYIGARPNISSEAILDFSGGGAITIGNNCDVQSYAIITTHCGNIKIGDNFAVAPFSILYGGGGLTIGDNVIIASNTIVIPANHNFDRIDIPIKNQESKKRGIVIKDDVWIGAGCTICDGVVIGKGCVIGAGSIVTKSLPDYSVAVGMPAKVIKKRG